MIYFVFLSACSIFAVRNCCCAIVCLQRLPVLFLRRSVVVLYYFTLLFKDIVSMKNIFTVVFSCLMMNIALFAQSDTILVNKDTLTVKIDSLSLSGDTLSNDTLLNDTLLNDTLSVASDTISVGVDKAKTTGDIVRIDTLVARIAVPVVVSSDSSVRCFFSSRLDSLVARYDTMTVDMNGVDGVERTNPTFVRMFMRPTLYRSVLGTDYLENVELTGSTATQMGVDAMRSQIIDGVLLNIYKNNPSHIWATEDEIRKEVTVDKVDESKTAGITLAPIQPVVIPDNVQGGLETKVVKPNYWRTYGAFGINYTQNFFSDNWRSGGENTKNMLVNVEFKLNYDDKKKIKFENHLEAKLGFYTSPSDTVHNVKTNQDLLRFTTKLGYKGWKDMYYTVQAQVWTQFLPFYDANKTDFRSNFMAPFNANFSFGIDYKPKIAKGTLSVYLAPLSAYNYRFVRYGNLAVSHFGIREGRHHYEDFGTKLEINGTFQLLKNFSWKTRLYYYTTYTRVEHDWENTFSFSFNKYISASMFVHSRFDDKARSQYSDKYGYWQLYHNMMIGLTYSW